MCGICGTTRSGDGTSLALMNQRMVQRGPDDEGIYLDRMADVGLGVRRLSIIDVGGGHQPASNEEETVWVVLNGEIYNHPALRDRLLSRGHQFRSRSDTEVLAHAYEAFGDDVVHALDGMFAFAIWDQRRERLLLARDRFGEKPLFYKHSGGVLTFASELTALLAACRGPAELSPQAVDAFFLLGYVPGPGTIVAGVQQLPPGHLLSWDRPTRTIAIRRYWAPQPMPSRSHGRRRELVEETSQLIEASVRACMISDVPLGVFLSGGVDSSLVAALAARNTSRPIKTFTVGYDIGGFNEFAPARRVAEVLGTDHREFFITRDDVETRVPAVLRALDQPIADQALIASHALAEGARQEVTVAVGGEGADELFGGYPRYRWLPRALRLQRMLPGPALAVGSHAAARLPLHYRGRRLADLLQPDAALASHFNWVTDGRAAQRRWLYGPRLRSAIAETPTSAALMPDLGAGLDGDVANIMRLDQSMWLPDDVLAKADRSSMLVSLEVRTPYLDRRLAELAFSVSSSLHCSGGGKWLLRAVLRGILGRNIAARPKVAFRVPSSEWLRGPLSGVLNQVQHGHLCQDGWFDSQAVASVIEQHHSGRRDWSSLLWNLMTFGIWLDSGRPAA